jgi:hypothetical protein
MVLVASVHEPEVGVFLDIVLLANGRFALTGHAAVQQKCSA